jgi:hypothetical protein
LQTKKRIYTRLEHGRKAQGVFERVVDAKRKHKNENAKAMEITLKGTNDVRERTFWTHIVKERF